ncbi:MAG: exopolyphosphatase [Magnetococcales bacterium]|nr:exopolyphosphatase [Magnetococcales bacterium]MBF0156249.1 exopolyphosphatase [Magnetococcales bacterium]
MKLAAIDVGSNAVRLLISNVYEMGEELPQVRKADLYRVPVRLGGDAFVRGSISAEVADRLVGTMKAFKILMEVCGAEAHMACATSALRSADNGESLVARVRSEAGLDLEIIDGAREAELIALNRLDERFRRGRHLFVDVGGGSTELTLLDRWRKTASRSFPIGTVRLKEGLVVDADWNGMKRWLKKRTREMPGLAAVGSGGNINKIFKLTNKRQEEPLTRDELKRTIRHLASLSLEERMVRVGLKPDRADVIIPAGRVFSRVMKWAGIERLHVPQIGLSDGMIHHLYGVLKRGGAEAAEATRRCGGAGPGRIGTLPGSRESVAEMDPASF